MTGRRMALILGVLLGILLFVIGFGLWVYTVLVPDHAAWLDTAFQVLGGWGAFIAVLAAVVQASLQFLGAWKPPPREGPPLLKPGCEAPGILPTFVGREAEIKRLLGAVRPGRKVAITGIVGMGGIGKTELAKVVANQVAPRFRDGVLWADCGDAGVERLPEQMAAVCGVPNLPGDDFQAKAAAWRGLISQKVALLVFDDVRPGHRVEDLFPPAGQSAVLLTCRHADHPALAGAEQLPLDRFSPKEATALAERILGKDEAGRQQLQAEVLFELLGYLPLAVSIALEMAQRHGWRLVDFNERLTKAGAMKTLDEAGLPKGLVATFDTAWDTLPPEQQRAFAVLAVFNQGPSFHTAAMAAVLDSEHETAHALLHRLASASLLTEVGEHRWSLHPLLREFVAMKLAADDPAWERMAAYYVQVAAAADKLYLKGGENMLMGLRLFDLEWPHVRAGHAWAVAHAALPSPPALSQEVSETPSPPALSQGVRATALRLCSDYGAASIYCLDLRLTPRDRTPWLEAAAKAAHLLGDKRAEGTHIGNLINAYADLGETQKAIALYEQHLAIAREIGDRRGEGNTLGNLGNAYAALGETRKAIAFYEQALAIAREIGDRRREAAALGNLGNAYADLGETRKAMAFYGQHLAIAREIGDRQGEGSALGNLGLGYAALGETRTAIGLYEQHLAIAREIGDRQGGGNALGNLGLAYAALGESRKAIAFHEQHLAIAREIGDRRGEGNALANMGLAYAALGEAAKARRLWQQALAIYQAIEDPNAQRVKRWLAELE